MKLVNECTVCGGRRIYVVDHVEEWNETNPYGFKQTKGLKLSIENTLTKHDDNKQFYNDLVIDFSNGYICTGCNKKLALSREKTIEDIKNGKYRENNV
jgi:DNA-directed RNA polymerase subunit RPC12/RpoP